MLFFFHTDQEQGCPCVDQWPIEQCETAKQSGECGESQIANNCLKTCGWCCDNVDGGKKNLEFKFTDICFTYFSKLTRLKSLSAP
jgi:hypothetical protein